MSWLDKIPTIGEIFDFCICRVHGHEWLTLDYQDGTRIRVCETCGKVEDVVGKK